MDRVIFAPNNPRAETIALTPSLDKILAHSDSIDDGPIECRQHGIWSCTLLIKGQTTLELKLATNLKLISVEAMWSNKLWL